MNLSEKFKSYVQKLAVKRIINYLPNATDKNLVRLTKIVERVTPREEDKIIVREVRKYFENGHPSVIYGKKILGVLHPNCRDKFAINLIVNSMLIGNGKREEICEKEGFPPPFTLLISPSMRCNLHCVGCYAQDYSTKDDLDFAIVDKVITEAKEIGTSFFTILGGEPFIWKDLFRMFKTHNDAYFQVFTNGTLIDKEMAEKLTEVGNVAVQVSVEGCEEETDARRGKGTFEKVMRAMDYLKEAGVMMGFSVAVTRLNTDAVTSDEFVDLMIKKGTYIGWYFLFMPIGKKPLPELMPTPLQRNKLRQRRQYIRNNKPIFIIDFWNDAPYVGGCIAARQYAHINHQGDVEPCIFAHFSTHNIKKSSLREALNSPYFKAVRRRQPFDDNLYLPCMLIDNPHAFRDIYEEACPSPSHNGAETLVEDEKLKNELDKYAKGVKKVYEKIWEEEDKSQFPSVSEFKDLDRTRQDGK